MSEPLLIYTQKITPRVRYVFKHIFTRVLGLGLDFTSDIETFVAHKGPKLSYTQKQLGNELHFRSVDLLMQQGVSDVEVQVSDWDGVPCFFPVKDPVSTVPYDIFAATFYLLSRYEEYLPHVKDSLGRFPPAESLAAKNDFLNLPLVDLWIARISTIIKVQYPEVALSRSSFTTEVLVMVPQAFAYKQIGFLRTLTGYFQDAFKFRLGDVFNRTRVLMGLRKDPYDIFNWLINMQAHGTSKFDVLFELGDQTSETTNLKYTKASFQSLIKMVGDYCHIGLLASVVSSRNNAILKEEKNRIEAIVNRPLQMALFSNHQFTIPQSYRNLLEHEVMQDYSMGYPDEIGFRASTCSSFLFYDLDYEMQTPLLIKPISLPLEAVINTTDKTINFVAIDLIKQRVKEVGGALAISCTNTTLSESHWKSLLKKLVILS